jgi:L-lactate dehydrogenase complex protein LldG
MAGAEKLAMTKASVLQNIRDALGCAAQAMPELQFQPAPRPPFTGDVLERMCERLRAHACTLQSLTSLDEAPQHVADWLAAHALPARIALAEPLAQLAWPATLERNTGPATKETRCAVSLAFAGIAETGGLMMLSGPDSPITHNFAPEYHIVVLHAASIVAYQEDAWRRLREQGPIPRAVNLIAGPSRTGDIEQTIQIGAHGPRAVHVLLVR